MAPRAHLAFHQERSLRLFHPNCHDCLPIATQHNFSIRIWRTQFMGHTKKSDPLSSKHSNRKGDADDGASLLYPCFLRIFSSEFFVARARTQLVKACWRAEISPWSMKGRKRGTLHSAGTKRSKAYPRRSFSLATRLCSPDKVPVSCCEPPPVLVLVLSPALCFHNCRCMN